MKNKLDIVTIGTNIRKYRDQKGITQERLAEICNCTSNHISEIERGKGNISLALLVMIANTIDVTGDQILKENYNRPEFTYLKEISERLEGYTNEQRGIACEGILRYLDALEKFSNK